MRRALVCNWWVFLAAAASASKDADEVGTVPDSTGADWMGDELGGGRHKHLRFAKLLDLLDQDHDEILSSDELQHWVRMSGEMKRDGTIRTVMESLDLNRDGKIEPKEIRAFERSRMSSEESENETVPSEEDLNKVKLLPTDGETVTALLGRFEVADADHSNSLSLDEIPTFLAPPAPTGEDLEKRVTDLFQGTDSNNDGVIDLAEFVRSAATQWLEEMQVTTAELEEAKDVDPNELLAEILAAAGVGTVPKMYGTVPVLGELGVDVTGFKAIAREFLDTDSNRDGILTRDELVEMMQDEFRRMKELGAYETDDDVMRVVELLKMAVRDQREKELKKIAEADSSDAVESSIFSSPQVVERAAKLGGLPVKDILASEEVLISSALTVDGDLLENPEKYGDFVAPLKDIEKSEGLDFETLLKQFSENQHPDASSDGSSDAAADADFEDVKGADDETTITDGGDTHDEL